MDWEETTRPRVGLCCRVVVLVTEPVHDEPQLGKIAQEGIAGERGLRRKLSVDGSGTTKVYRVGLPVSTARMPSASG